MTVPLVQGTLRYAYKQYDKTDDGEKAESEGATFAAAVLPFVYSCDKADAKIIHDHVAAGHTQATDFVPVKEAFERNYRCMGITCKDVGGIWDDVDSKYLDKAAPCGTSTTSNITRESGVNNPGLAIGLAVGGALFVALVVILSSFCGEKAAPLPSEPQTEAHSETFAVS